MAAATMEKATAAVIATTEQYINRRNHKGAAFGERGPFVRMHKTEVYAPSCGEKGGMAMAKRGNGMQRAKDLAAEYAYVVTLACVIAVIVGSAAYTQSVRKQTQDALIEAAAGAPEVEVTAAPTAETGITPLPTIVPLSVRVTVFEERTAWPVEGEVIRHHDLQEAVFWEALDVWQVHAGIDIEGKAEQGVRCAGGGTVKRVTRDALWGGSVEIEQEDGRRTVYRGLALQYVDEGDAVVCGQEIGTLLEGIPCEAELGAHLHMEAVRDGVSQDPLAILPER